MTAQQRTKLERLIRRACNAELDDSWKGGGDPADWPAITRELRKARLALKAFLDELTKEQTQ